MKLRHTLLMAAFIFLAESKGGFFDKGKKWGSVVAEGSSVNAVSSFEEDKNMGEGLVKS
jgi:hypothetical protein